MNRSKFNHKCGSIRRVLNKRARKKTQIRHYETMAIPTLVNMDTDKPGRGKNDRNRRNEIL
jgi:hypothetical protein